jgi:hypothetical protein
VVQALQVLREHLGHRETGAELEHQGQPARLGREGRRAPVDRTVTQDRRVIGALKGRQGRKDPPDLRDSEGLQEVMVRVETLVLQVSWDQVEN